MVTERNMVETRNVRASETYKKNRHLLGEKFKLLLGPMCNLEVITGLAIFIAGWSQIQTITYYHKQLVSDY